MPSAPKVNTFENFGEIEFLEKNITYQDIFKKYFLILNHLVTISKC